MRRDKLIWSETAENCKVFFYKHFNEENVQSKEDVNEIHQESRMEDVSQSAEQFRAANVWDLSRIF